MISQVDIISALKSAGVETGMTVFSHANIAFFGRVEGASNMESLIRIMLECFSEVLGPDGTLVLPVFTYSFGSDKPKKVFDVQRSLSTTSGMGNWLVSAGAGARSADPMLSVAAMGGRAEALTADIGNECFGPDSIWARLYAEDALICNLNRDSGSTFLHWVERKNNVPYRSDIPMSGTIIDNGVSRQAEITYCSRALDDPMAVPKFEAYHTACVDNRFGVQVPLGRGQIVAQSARGARQFLEEQLVKHPYLLTERFDAT